MSCRFVFNADNSTIWTDVRCICGGRRGMCKYAEICNILLCN